MALTLNDQKSLGIAQVDHMEALSIEGPRRESYEES